MNKLFNDESGFSMVLALSVAFVVFALGTVWWLTSGHELDEVIYSEHRVAAQTAAEGGARYAMAVLADDIIDPTWIGVAADNSTTVLTADGVRTALANPAFAYVASGTSDGALGSTCDLAVHRSSAAGDQLGLWWVRIVPVDLDEHLYQVESWGWGPSTTHRQHVTQKVAIQVKLVSEFGGFTHALFAESHLTGLNRKEVYGDVYAGSTANISNSTSVYVNEAGHPGLGKLRVNGDLVIASGSNNFFQGRVDVQGVVRDDKSGSAYADLYVRNDESIEPATAYGGDSYFKKANVSSQANFLTGSWSGEINGTVVNPVNPMADVPAIPLPGFVWNAAQKAAYVANGFTVVEHASVAAFETWFAANKNDLQHVHHVPGPLNLNFNGSRMVDSFMVISDGDMSVTKTPSTAASVDAMDLVLVQLDPAGRLTTSNQVTSVDGVLHLLLFSNGEFDAANQTTVYGAIYGKDDVSTNRVEIHFRPPDDEIVVGFDFTAAPPDSYTAQPLVWRSLNVSDPTPITDYCGVPGGAAASVPPPGSTTTTSTTTTTVGPTTTTTSTTTTTTTTLPQQVCVKWNPQGKCTQWA